MTPFQAAQAADPFDPAPMLIQADWLEERGDLVGAEALRGLAGAGVPSLVALAGAADAVVGREIHADRFGLYGTGLGDRLGLPGGGGCGHGDDFGNTLRGDYPGMGFGGGDGHPSFGAGSNDPHGNGDSEDQQR